ncbi:MAG: hypothetical protein Q7S02_04875 [bacterium]|nr:hypothetical protein [bacterium]
MEITVLLLHLALVLGTLVVLGTFAWGAFRGAPWVPTRRVDIDRAVAFAGVRSGMVVADVGCGDGSVLAAFAAAGCRIRGWELAIVPWFRAWWRFRRHTDARIRFGDFWYADLSECDLVYAYLLPKTYVKLARKLSRELRHGARVVAFVWPFPGWEPIAVDRAEGRAPLYLYERKASDG